MTVWVLGDQLTRSVGPVANRPDEDVLLVEAHDFARRKPYHPQKLTLLFSAMRHYRDELRAAGRTVHYHRAETFREGLAAYFSKRPGDELVVMRPASHEGGRLQSLCADLDGSLAVVDNDLFICAADQFDRWAGDVDETGADRLRHEDFYRFLRRETGYLVDGDEPVGGQFNFDDQNRETPRPNYEFPDPPTFEADEITREVHSWVRREFDTWGEPAFDDADGRKPDRDAGPATFRWPVTRDQALSALDHFLDYRLGEFGPYQDAMLREEWALNHALLSSSLNLGLLHPREVIERAIAVGHDRDVPINSLEGFVRQVLGWREFLRHVYRRTMPDLASANQLGADEDLPPVYTTGETDMECMDRSVGGVYDRGYAHHIQRLMVLSNFGLLYGVEPAQLNEWFHYGFVDAYHWVTTPNVVEMGLYGAGVFATKPYAASANYVDRMSDYCEACPYDQDAATGEDACPFNALYWDFLADNEDDLRSNHRMGLMYGHVDTKRENGDLEAIRERARRVRALAREGKL